MGKNLTLPLVEFGQVQVPAELRGRDGTLRAHGVRSIDAQDDLEAVQEWLKRCTNKHTQRAYRREVERLFLWLIAVKQKPLSSLRLGDYKDYEKFLANPEPRERWCANPDGYGEDTPDNRPRQRPRRAAMDWKPFSQRLQPKSIAYAMNVLKMLAKFLFDTGYLALNPMATFKIKKPDRRAATDRYLDYDLMSICFDSVEALPRDSEEERRVYERARFLLRLLYGVGARPHEVVQAVMGDLVLRDGCWWWYIVGKGQKERKVAMPAGLMEALTRYRKFRGLKAIPDGREKDPLVTSVRGKKPLRDANALRKAMAKIFDAIKKALPDDDPRQKVLKGASTHWLRHTFASHALDGGAKLKDVQDALGHASLDTLSIYTHAEDSKQHAAFSTQYDRLIPP